ncbi:MAG TPA: DUF423 domain-containing protein [Pirellulales bacterium]|nr:DUF423 domain-containing protein [Pirellulales bacterium]
MLKPNSWIACGAMLAGLAVVSGAFGAHGLKDFLKESRNLTDESVKRPLEIYETAVRYQMYHALALVLVGVTAVQRRSPWLNAAGWGFVAGMAVFSGCLYAMVFGAPAWLGAVVPLGGLALVVAWFVFAVAASTAGSGKGRSAP